METRAAVGTRGALASPMDTTPTFTVERHGQRWAILSEGEVLLIAARKADAEALARAAAETLSVTRRPTEARSFARDD